MVSNRPSETDPKRSCTQAARKARICIVPEYYDALDTGWLTTHKQAGIVAFT
jgi:hypothetical protein